MKKDYPNGFVRKKREYICSTSSLPVLELESFTNIKIAEDYYFNVKKIGDSILYVRGRGNIANTSVEKYYKLLDGFIAAALVKKPYVEIRDLSDTKGRVPNRELKRQKKYLRDNENRIAGFILCNPPFWIQAIVMPVFKTNQTSTVFSISRNYKKAVLKAVEILEKKEQPEEKTLESQNIQFPSEKDYIDAAPPLFHENEGATEKCFLISQNDINEINTLCGGLIWDGSRQNLYEDIVSPDNKLSQLKETLNVVKTDILNLRQKDLYQARNLMEIFESIPVGVVIIERSSHKIIFVNTAAAAILKNTPDNMKGRVCYEFICPAKPGSCPITSSNKEIYHEEKFLLRSDGSSCCVLKSVKPFVFQEIPCFIETFTDITKRKQSQQELKASEERLNLAMMAADYGVWDWDIKSGNILFDSRCYTMGGYEPNEYPGKLEELEKRIHPEDLQEIKSAIKQFLSGETEIHETNFRFLRKDGKYMWIQSRGKVVTADENGKPVRYVGTHSDITERKLREKRIEDLNRLQTVLWEQDPLDIKLKQITDTLISSIDADSAKIWLLRPGDICEKGCIHYMSEFYNTCCLEEGQCLHLISASGRYTRINDDSRRIPVGALQIGEIFASRHDDFLSNRVISETWILNKKYVKDHDLISFASYKLSDPEKGNIGIMALFSQNTISSEVGTYLKSISNLVSQVILNFMTTSALEDALQLTERANTLMEGREIRIRQMKEEINSLSVESGGGVVYETTMENTGKIVTNAKREEITLQEARLNALSLAEDAEIARREAIDISEQLSIIKQAVNSSSDAVAISTTYGDFFYINNTFTELFGYDITELAIISLKKLFKESLISEALFASTGSGTAFQGRVEIISKKGEICPVYMRSAPFKDREDQILGLIWNFTDITEQIKSEERIRQYTNTIEKDLEEKRTMLQKASHLQRSFIQTRLPIIEEINIHALYMPCENLGGDFFHVVKGVYENKLAIVIGDCTDHGIKASMDASLLSSMVNKHLSLLYSDDRTDLFLNKLSVEYSKLADEDQFPTIFAAVINLDSKKMFYSNANGELPYLIKDNTIARIDSAEGMHLGYHDNPMYERKSIQLHPHDRLLFYSDAVIEINEENNSMLGYSGIEEILIQFKANSRGNFEFLIDQLKKRNNGFPLNDDATLILLEVSEALKKQFEFRNLDEWKIYLKKIEKILYLQDYSPKEIEELSVCFNELFTNTFKYNNNKENKKTIVINTHVDCKDVIFSIEKVGGKFKPELTGNRIAGIKEKSNNKNREKKIADGKNKLLTIQDFFDSISYDKNGSEITVRKQKKHGVLHYFN